MPRRENKIKSMSLLQVRKPKRTLEQGDQLQILVTLSQIVHKSEVQNLTESLGSIRVHPSRNSHAARFTTIIDRMRWLHTVLCTNFISMCFKSSKY